MEEIDDMLKQMDREMFFIKTIAIIMIVVVIFGTVGAILTFSSDLTGATHIESVTKVKCFDRFEHEIKGLECEEEDKCSDWYFTYYGKCEK